MSLNNVRQYALMLVLLCGASGLPGIVQAAEEDCDMMSAVKKVDYGRYRKEDMRKASTEHVGKVYNGYASVTREFQVSVLCPDARKMRISVDGAARQNMAYRFTDSGAMKIEFRDGRVDGSPVQLAAVDIGAVAVQGGASQVTLKPEKALAAVNGTEVVGEQFTATMMITTYLSDEAFGVTNTTDFNEMLTLNLDTLPAR
ncbi:DUF1120 domain-containing protein [Enterobacter mori]|uniref:Uncharacterized protein n=1 Tax=Enterobacter mori TaxID=539813 RepID=A0A9Q7K1L8_9ENTR|nr:hypothetical protein [Enterobacter mori]MCC8232053.1 hypothetical protein [Enterobacter mori]MCC8241590.1 hypothetical protein [Enterobacter mori]RTQ23195.1 hypothetical protein EKN29_16280 [Enterobacter mori]